MRARTGSHAAGGVGVVNVLGLDAKGRGVQVAVPRARVCQRPEVAAGGVGAGRAAGLGAAGWGHGGDGPTSHHQRRMDGQVGAHVGGGHWETAKPLSWMQTLHISGQCKANPPLTTSKAPSSGYTVPRMQAIMEQEIWQREAGRMRTARGAVVLWRRPSDRAG
jgi:hypothetical protein